MSVDEELTSVSFVRSSVPDEPLEVVAARGVAAVGVPVEAGARRRQQHHVAR